MRDYVINGSLKLIKKQNPDFTEEKMEILEYGLTGLYILITKSIIIFSIAYLLGILKELVIFMIIYNLIRSVSFGLHAASSKACLIASATTFLTATYICKYFIIPINVRIVLGIIGIMLIFIYSPADTEKKPIISSKRRRIYKYLSTLIATLMITCSILIDNPLLANSFILALLIQCVMISPITYKLANQKYNNYIDYQLN